MAAAGTMSQLRNALRGYLFLGQSPSAALRNLNEFAVNLLPSVFGTVFVACLNPATGTVVASSAGHVMPFIVTPGERSDSVAVRGSLPVGVQGAVYSSGEFHVPRGSGLVLFSDGLVERRGGNLTGALDRLYTLGAGSPFGCSASSFFQGSQLPDAEDDSTVVMAWRDGLREGDSVAAKE
jgi:chemotaxis family two-component system sensor kinase Cph1